MLLHCLQSSWIAALHLSLHLLSQLHCSSPHFHKLTWALAAQTALPVCTDCLILAMAFPGFKPLGQTCSSTHTCHTNLTTCDTLQHVISVLLYKLCIQLYKITNVNTSPSEPSSNPATLISHVQRATAFRSDIDNSICLKQFSCAKSSSNIVFKKQANNIRNYGKHFVTSIQRGRQCFSPWHNS